jgi:peptide/nickel transport system ATP-binding protein
MLERKKVMRAILELKGVEKTFDNNRKGSFRIKSLDLRVMPGETFGLVGESGSGKSTIAKLSTRLVRPDEGKILIDGKDIAPARGKKLKEAYGKVQMIFQDSYSSFDDRMKVGASISETIKNFQGYKKSDCAKEVDRLLERVGLKKSHLHRYPYELSGGECQRAAIARALAAKPKLLICDEATSALDVSVQHRIIRLLKKLRKEVGLGIFFISHDLALVSSFCDRLGVMKDGVMVETGSCDEIMADPKHPYTKELMEASLFINEI